MPDRGLAFGAVLAGVWAAVVPGSWARAEDEKTVLQFVQGLRERGYFALAADYLEQLRHQPQMPAGFQAVGSGLDGL